MKTIAIDLGGTNVRTALVQDDAIVEILSQPCLAAGTESDVIGQIFGMTDSLFAGDVDGIGIGVPSVVDVDNGIVYDVIGIPSWKEVHLKSLMEERYGVPVRINNDCNCFSLGVAHFGEAKGYRDVVCVTLGTGVGSSLIINGELYSGKNTGAGEIGNIPYLDRDYEYYCSSRFFIGKGTTGVAASEAAMKGDAAALALWDEFGVHIGKLVTMVIYAYDPEILVFGGSISKAFGLFRDSMYREMGNCAYSRSAQHLVVRPSVKDNLGILGASSLFKGCRS